MTTVHAKAPRRKPKAPELVVLCGDGGEHRLALNHAAARIVDADRVFELTPRFGGGPAVRVADRDGVLECDCPEAAAGRACAHVGALELLTDDGLLARDGGDWYDWTSPVGTVQFAGAR